MKKKIYNLILSILICILITGCTPSTKTTINNENIEQNQSPLKDISLEEKIGQMLIINYPKDTYDTEFQNIIKTIKPGGFILMPENIKTYNNTLSLIKNIQKDSNIKMIISIDEEGGRVQRTKSLTDIQPTDIPYMYDLGKTNNETLAYQVGTIIAKKVRTLGVNLNFAPVLDIYNNPNNKVIGKRSFGNNAKTVIKMSMALQKGIEDNQVNTCVKHFPGHGDTEIDSHYELPIINKTYEELLQNELLPFITAINNNTKMIMVGHIAFPKITNNSEPASLSKEIITNILKNKLNYKGLIITDALNMKAITNNYSEKEIYIKAINAGVDLLLMPKNPQNAVKYIKEALNEGTITIDQIDSSVIKILTYKEKYLKENYLDKSYLNKEEYKTILNNIN